MRDTEATNERMDHQNQVLKNEVRKLEKNQERERSILNLEYLKNVIYEFITGQPGDKRLQLIMVIDTMLKLSPEEKENLEKIARGETEQETEEASKSWSYIPRWGSF